MGDDFREIPHHKLDAMSDEQLLAYIVRAQDAVHARAIEDALWRLIDRYRDRVFAKVANKLPSRARAEEIAADATEAAVRAVLGGKEIDNFKAWIFRVAANKIADFWRSPEGQQLKIDRAAAGRDDDDAGRDDENGVSEDEFDAFELEDLVESVMAELSESHRRVVELFVFDDLSARDVSAETGESEANVYQIAKRFRTRLRRRLEFPDGDTGGAS